MAPTHQLRAIKHMTNRRPKPSGVFLSAVDVSGRRVQPGAPAPELREKDVGATHQASRSLIKSGRRVGGDGKEGFRCVVQFDCQDAENGNSKIQKK